MAVLVVNAGSMSVKLSVVDEDDRLLTDAELGPPDGPPATQIEDFLHGLSVPVDAVGHRVVHGGARYREATLVDDATRAAMDDLTDLAPLHNPAALAGIDATRRLLPDTPTVACFDTAFHADLPEEAYTYALPAQWAGRWGIRRYGFHGLSCAWATGRAAALLGRPVEELRLIICHLGGGASVTAVVGGRSVDTTMGFTPLEGLVMATRSGDVDPGALLWLLRHGLTTVEADDGLEHRAGLLGLSGGRSADMRALLAARTAGDHLATLALDVYLHRLRAKIAAMTAASRGLDALVFTGGVGEHSAPVREEAVAGLAWLGLRVDRDINAAPGHADADISATAKGPRILVIRAREDLQIAAETRRLLGAGGSLRA
jgi:acetate kinase